MRKLPCSAVPAYGLKFSTSVGLPVSPWIVSVPPELVLDFTSEPPQADMPSSAVAATAAHHNVGLRFIVSPRSVSPVAPRGWTGRGATGCAPRPASEG